MRLNQAAGPAPGQRWPARLALALWLLTLLVAAARLDHLLRQAGLPELAILSGGNLPLVVAAVSAATVGAVLAARRPRHPVGWLLLAGLGLSISGFCLLFTYTRYGLVARPGSLPAADYLAGLAGGLVLVYLWAAGLVLLLTPTGTLPSPRWRWLARVAAAALGVALLASALSPAPLFPEYPDIGSPIGVAALGGDGPVAAVFPLCALIILVGLVAGAGSLVGRFRGARGVERQQLKWLALAAAVAAGLLVVALADLTRQQSDPSFVFEASVAGCVALLPLATGAAILRYRLYDLDRVISRTLAWGLLTVLLGLGYAAVVLGLGWLLPESSSLTVAGATLAVAAAFQPARRRIQRLVDRRFNRRRYDAARTIAAFSARLRDQVDLDTLAAELLAVADQTMQPTRASVWLRPTVPAGRGTPAGRPDR
jgi:hypothetical protein